MKMLNIIVCVIVCFIIQAKADVATTNEISNPVITRTNTLTIEVGVVMKSGDIKPLARTDFFLCPESLDSILISELKTHPATTAEDFCKARGFSPELMNYLKSLNFNLEIFDYSIKDYNSPIPLEIIRKTPELFIAFSNSFVGFIKYSGLKGTKAIEAAHHDYYSELPSSVIRAFSDFQTLKANELKLTRLNVESKAKSQAVTETKTDFSGKATFAVQSGIYWLSNIEESSIGNSSILWDYKISITNDIPNLELSNDNAYRISDNSP